jgi:hypothetical protein
MELKGSPFPSRSPTMRTPAIPSFRKRRATKLNLGIENQDYPASASRTEPRAPVISLACHLTESFKK